MAWSSRSSLVHLILSSTLLAACGDGGDDGGSSTTFSSIGDETAEGGAEAADAASEGGESGADAGDGDAGAEAETDGGDGDTQADTEAEAEADGGDGDAGAEDGADGSLSCEECWMANCSSERSSCEGDTDCACILECVEGGGSPGQCKSECGVQGSNEPYNAWQECVDLNCAGAR
jgi:hypothetical protein